MSEPLRMFLIAHTDSNDDNFDYFVAATTHQEAFELWRIDQEVGHERLWDDDAQATVFPIPDHNGKPELLHWPHATAETFSCTLMNLTSLAIRREHGLVSTEPTNCATE